LTHIGFSSACSGNVNRFSGQRLTDLAPACFQVQLKAPNGLWQEVGRTEVVQNNLNPVFKKKVEMDYTFEKQQQLKFLVYDS
jgi:hypothetical protein